MKDVNSRNASSMAWGGPNLKVCPLNNVGKEVDNDTQVSDRYEVSEPSSVVLNCKLCGASVGLWAFSSVWRPLEFLRLVGYTNIDRKHAIGYSKDPAPGDVLAGNENVSGSTEGIHTAFAPFQSNDKTSSLNLTIAGGPPPEKQNYRATISLPVIGRTLIGRFSLDSVARKNHDISLAQATTTEPGTHQLGESASSLVITSEKMQVVLPDSSSDGKLVENAESEERVDTVVQNSYISLAEEGPSMSAEGNVSKGTDEFGENSAATVLQANNLQGDRANDNTKEGIALQVDNSSVPGNSGKSLDHKLVNSSVAFDPIRQHRPFCPWIVAYGNSAPGWKQTLFALQHHKESSYSLSKHSPASIEGNGKRSVIEVDDPVASANMFFNSPPAKRTKYDHTS